VTKVAIFVQIFVAPASAWCNDTFNLPHHFQENSQGTFSLPYVSIKKHGEKAFEARFFLGGSLTSAPPFDARRRMACQGSRNTSPTVAADIHILP
jgi:hypothetical protein